MSRENVEMVRRVFDAFVQGLGGGDPALPFDTGLVAPDAEWRPVSGWPGPNSYVGRDGWSEFLNAWLAEFDSYTVELERLIDAREDTVLAVLHQSATGKGSGTPVDWHFAALFEVQDGKVAVVQNYADVGEALEAVGLPE